MHRIFSRYSFYNSASQELRNQIIGSAKGVALDDGKFFFEAGQVCPHVGLVGSGSIRVYAEGESGREITLYHVGPGETCPINIVSCLLKLETTANAVVEDDLVAAIVPVGHFQQWIESHLEVRELVLHGLATRFASVVSLVREITTKRVDVRLAEFLLAGFAVSNEIPAAVAATHKTIALELGTAREVVTRLLHEFERAAAVSLHRGRVEAVDDSYLRSLCRA